MISFLVSCRLKRLSRSITAHTFRHEDKALEDYKAAYDNLYFDMLQYQQEHPNISYRRIYDRFVDKEMHQALRKQLRWHCFLSTAIICLLLATIGILALTPFLNTFLHSIPVFHL